MKISVEITLIPLREDYISTIKKFIKSLRSSEFKILENPLSTQIYGDYDLLMNLLNSKIKTIFIEEKAIMIQIKIVKGDRSNYEPDF
jgi:uncharacterized protein YqgV (UPF0045/DUF77 family)